MSVNNNNRNYSGLCGGNCHDTCNCNSIRNNKQVKTCCTCAYETYSESKKDVWKQEQAEKTAFYKVKAQAVIDYNDAAQKQAQMVEAKEQEHEHKKK